MKTFAAIDVGSYQIGMKIFELSARNGLREIDHVRHRVDLGTDTYNTGKIAYERMDELCDILNGFNEIMLSYKVDAYQAYGTSAIRETKNTKIVLDQIRLRTGMDIQPLANAEQRFLDYKSIALRSDQFDRIIDKGTVIVDIGGGSTQVSIFSNARLIATVNLQLGILRIREKINLISPRLSEYEGLIEEMIDNELEVFRELYLGNLDIQNIIAVDDYLPYMVKRIREEGSENFVTGSQYMKFVDEMKTKSRQQMARELGIPEENSTLLMPSALIIQRLIEITGADRMWMPGVSLCDGIAYDYAQKHRIIKTAHDFDKDIISSAENILLRYHGSQMKSDILSMCALAVFDSMRKIHGLSRRERLLLELSARLRDIGRFVSISSPAESSYSIIMGTEIIGLSHLEMLILATVVLNSYETGTGYIDFKQEEFGEQTYLIVAKLSSILTLATGIYRSPSKIYTNVSASLRDKQLIITVDAEDDLIMEKRLFNEKTESFEEVFGIRPVLRRKARFTI